MGPAVIPLVKHFHFWNALRKPDLGIKIEGSRAIVGVDSFFVQLDAPAMMNLGRKCSYVANWGLRKMPGGSWYVTKEVIEEIMLLMDRTLTDNELYTCMSD